MKNIELLDKMIIFLRKVEIKLYENYKKKVYFIMQKISYKSVRIIKKKPSGFYMKYTFCIL